MAKLVFDTTTSKYFIVLKCSATDGFTDQAILERQNFFFRPKSPKQLEKMIKKAKDKMRARHEAYIRALNY